MKPIVVPVENSPVRSFSQNFINKRINRVLLREAIDNEIL